MKLSFVTTNPTVDILNWSGTEFYMAQTLEKYFDVEYVTNVKTSHFTLASIRKICRYVRGEKYGIERSPEVGRAYAKQVARRISPDTDIIFFPSSIPLAYLKVDKPKVFFTDATFASILNYYEDAVGLGKKTIEEGINAEKLALKNCDLALYSSDWAAQSAINDLGANPEKVKVIPFGANLSEIFSKEEIQKSIESRSEDICKIIFIGVDWKRKGGDIVLEAVEKLNNMGISAEMHIVGLELIPREVSDKPFVVNHGFLNKNKTEDITKFNSLLSSSHFLFVPSKAEAYGLVFCEAAAFGVPSISSKTGGITTIIKDGLNGQTFDIGADPEEFALYIEKIFKDKSAYEKLALSSYQEYISRLNWNVSGEILKKHILSLLNA